MRKFITSNFYREFTLTLSVIDIIDEYHSEALAMEASFFFPAERVIEIYHGALNREESQEGSASTTADLD
jgi:hypothetical protein